MATVDADSPCPKCGGDRVRYERSKGGFTAPVCKPCNAAQMRERYKADPQAAIKRVQAYYAANAEAVKAKARAAYREDPDKYRAAGRADYHKNVEARKAKSRAWREANPERQAELTARWREANRDRIKAYNAGYYADNREREIARVLAYLKANPDVQRAIRHKRAARKRAVVCEHGEGCVTSAFLKTVRESVCLYCGAAAEQADHFIPLSRGGLHCVDNIVPACTHCNTSKHASDPHEWLAGLPRRT